jgi:glucokinase
MTASVILSLDIGGSHITAALVDPKARQVQPGSVVREATYPDWSGTQLLGSWAAVALRTAREVLKAQQLVGVSVAMPAPFDYLAGISHHHSKFGALSGINVSAALLERWQDTPLAGVQDLRFANDADLFALGEAWAGAARQSSRVLGITLGTGLGSGFVAHRQILTDGPGVPPGGELWNRPYRQGIAEDYVSSLALTREYARLTGVHCRGATELAAFARQGNGAAQEVWRTFGQHAGELLRQVVGDFGPDQVVFGGNLTRAWDLFGAEVAACTAVPLQVSKLFEAAALLGGAALHCPVGGEVPV